VEFGEDLISFVCVSSKEDYRGEYQKDADKDTEQKKLKENVLGRRVSKPSGRYPSDMWSV
jgi:hypothetical protein